MEDKEAELTPKDMLIASLSQAESTDESVNDVTNDNVDKEEDEQSELQENEGQEAEETTAESDESSDEEGEPDEVKSPNWWTKEEKELFNELDDGIKKAIANNELKRESLLGKQRTELEQTKQAYGDLDETLGYIKSKGAQPVDYIKGLIDLDKSFSSDPRGTIDKLAAMANITLDKGESSTDDLDEEYMTDTELRLKRRVEELENKVSREVQPQQPRIDPQQNIINDAIQRFQTAKDEQGKEMFTGIDEEAAAEIAKLVELDRFKNPTKDYYQSLVDAYKLSPIVQSKSKHSADVRELTRKAAEKRKAGKSVVSKSVQSDSSLSGRDLLITNLKKAGF